MNLKLASLSKYFVLIIFALIFVLNLELYNFLLVDYLTIWQVLIILMLVCGILTYILLIPLISDFNIRFFYCLMFLICIVEFFLVLIPWPTNNESKSALVVIISYIIWGMINLQSSNQLLWKNLMPYIIIGLIAICGIVSTIVWQGY